MSRSANFIFFVFRACLRRGRTGQLCVWPLPGSHDSSTRTTCVFMPVFQRRPRTSWTARANRFLRTFNRIGAPREQSAVQRTPARGRTTFTARHMQTGFSHLKPHVTCRPPNRTAARRARARARPVGTVQQILCNCADRERYRMPLGKVVNRRVSS